MGKFIVKNLDRFLETVEPKTWTEVEADAHIFSTSDEAFQYATANHMAVIDLEVVEFVVKHPKHGNYVSTIGEKVEYTKDVRKAYTFEDVDSALKYRTNPSEVVLETTSEEYLADVEKERSYRKTLKGFKGTNPVQIRITSEMGADLTMPNITLEAILVAIDRYLK